MPEPLKNLYSEELIASLSLELKSVYGQFDSERFRESIFSENWDQKALKERMTYISVTLHQFLPSNYREAIEILKSVSSRFSGFEYMFFPGYVALYGLDAYEESISALEHFTKYSSSEFAVRPFIKKYPNRMMAQMAIWAESSNPHVRRLASEGCRPRLPWAMALPEFKENPDPVLKILEELKHDESEYVRRSVANNLNDISKDNPQLLLDVAKKWLGLNTDTDRLVKHACRFLLKQGNPEILALFGFVKPSHISIEAFKVQESVYMGENLEFSFILETQQGKLGLLRIEYAVDFMKNNGKLSRKRFKISEADYSGPKKLITKHHSFKSISTRKYYAGIHGLAVIVNGQELAYNNFVLDVKC